MKKRKTKFLVANHIVDSLNNADPSSQKFDATDSGGFWFRRELTHVMKELFYAKQKPLNSFTMFPADTRVPVGVKYWEMKSMRPIGEAQWIDDYAKIEARATVVGFSVTKEIRNMSIQFEYSEADIWHGRQTGVGLDVAEAIAAKRGTMLKHNRALFDDLFSSAVTRIMLDTNWETATSTEIVKALDGIISYSNYMDESVTLDTMYVPKKVSDRLQEKYTETHTIGSWIVEQHSEMKQIKRIREMEKSYNGLQDFIFLKDSKVGDDGITAVMPQPYLPKPVQVEGLMYKVPVIASNGGLNIKYPFNSVLVELAD